MTNRNKSIYILELITKLLLIVLPFFMISITNNLIPRIRVNQSSSVSPVIPIGITVISMLLVFLIIFVINKQLKRSLERNEIISFTKAIKSNKLVKVTTTIMIAFTLFVHLVYTMQDQLIFHPNHSVIAHNLLKENNYEAININNTYFGWASKSEYVDAKTVIYFGGNGESSAKVLANHHKNETNEYYKNVNLFIIDYPSYGLSKGKPSQTSLFEMALETYDYIANLDYVNSNDISVIGFSLGTGVASYVNKNRAVQKLILLAPYNDFTNAMNQFFPIFHGPFKRLVKYKFDSTNYLKTSNTETLIVYSKKDELISFKLTELLIGNLNDNITAIKVDHLTHNEIPNDKNILFLINNFIHN